MSTTQVTLTLEELAAVVSSAVLTGIEWGKKSGKGDPDDAAASFVARGMPGMPTLAAVLASFRKANRKRGAWVAYVAQLTRRGERAVANG